MQLFRRFWRDQSGTTVIEYCVIASLVTVGLIAAFSSIGSKLNHMMQPVSNGLN
jgi:pilus assembly protein Flp/PilA